AAEGGDRPGRLAAGAAAARCRGRGARRGSAAAREPAPARLSVDRAPRSGATDELGRDLGADPQPAALEAGGVEREALRARRARRSALVRILPALFRPQAATLRVRAPPDLHSAGSGRISIR